MPPLRKIKHLLVIRTSAMGDVAMLPHALRAFRERYPDTKITLATKEIFAPFFRGLDVTILSIDTKKRHRGILGAIRYAREIRAMGVDAVADMHNVLRSKLIRAVLWYYGIPTRAIDKDRRDKKRLIAHKPVTRPLTHTVVRYCDVLRRLGFVFEDPKPIEKHPGGGGVGFAPFSAHTGKTYPEPHRSELVRLLSEKHETVYLHSGGGTEAAWAYKMESLYPNVTALHGKLKLGDELDLIATLDTVISMDSLVMHLASLVGTRCVSIWGATHPDLGFLGYGADPADVIQLDLPCRPCSVYGNKPCHLKDYPCLNIPPQYILSFFKTG